VTSKITIMQTGLLRWLAPQLGAAVIYGEHRYYGKSLPFGAASLQPENLVHLTMENAMADYVRGLLWARDSFGITGPVIAFGCSYGGMLTAWFKFRYPQHVFAAVASPPPVLLYSPDTAWGDVTLRPTPRFLLVPLR